MAKKGKFQQPRTEKPSEAEAAVHHTKKNHKKSAVIAAVVAGSLVAAILLIALIWGGSLLMGRTIYPNVHVAGINVGGLTPSEAQLHVDEAVSGMYAAQPLQVELPDRTLSFDPVQTNVTLHAEEAIAAAREYGRQKGVFGALFTYLSSLSKSHDIELEAALQLDTNYVQAMIRQVAEDVKIPAENSVVSMNKDKTEMTIQVGVTGRELDEEALYQVVYEAYETGELSPISWDYTEVPFTQVDLDALYADMTEGMADAYYDEEARKIVPGVDSIAFDLELARQKLKSAHEGVKLVFPLETVSPEITEETIRQEMFPDQLERRSSKYVNNPKRTENLRLACEAINGTILNPGDVFSFNEVVGERTEEKGYQPATIYGGDGESLDGVGGGICQVASTIYYTTLYLALEQVERAPHMYQVYYVPVGMDATIYWDSKLDYKFRNNREHPLMIMADLEGDMCNITILGTKENDNYVEMSSWTTETFESEDVEELDETKPVGYREQKQWSYTGAKAVACQKIFDGSGKLLKTNYIYSEYKSRPNIFIVGPSAEVPVDPGIPEDPWGDVDITIPETPDSGDAPWFPEDENWEDWLS